MAATKSGSFDEAPCVVTLVRHGACLVNGLVNKRSNEGRSGHSNAILTLGADVTTKGAESTQGMVDLVPNFAATRRR